MIRKKSNIQAGTSFFFTRNQKLKIWMVFTLLTGISTSACSSTLDDRNSKSAPAVYYLNPEANTISPDGTINIPFTGLEIKADGGGIKSAGAEEPEMRCGVLVQTSQPGNYENIVLSDLTVKNIFFEEPQFNRGEDEV